MIDRPGRAVGSDAALAPRLWDISGADPSAVALSQPGRARTWTELEDRTNAIGHGLEARGLEPGSHVLLMCSNRVEFVEALLGGLRAGMIVTPVKTGWTPDEVGYVANDAGSRAVVTDQEAGRAVARDADLVLVDLDDRFDGWIERQDRSSLPRDRCGWRMSYTSGTTGRPKGVFRYQDGQRPWCEAFAASQAYVEMLHLPPTGPHLNVSALFHGAPLAFALSLLASGATFRITERWDPASVLDALEDGVHTTCMVPSMFRQLLALPDARRQRFDAPELRTVLHGGEPCPQPLKRRMIEWWGPVFVEYFGMTEGGMTAATSEEWLERPGTVGKPTRDMQILVLDDDGRELPVGQDGTVYFLAPGGRFFEYRNEPGKTDAAHTPDGAFTVGDLGHVDEDGYLYISGRTADVIVTSGVNVYPAQIEDVLFSLPEVADACVVGGPDEERGETPVAFVQLVDGTAPDAGMAAVEAACEARLASYERPRRFELSERIPRDPTGKLLRNEARAPLWEGHDDGFAVDRS